jgi:type II secretion system protein J
MKLNSSRRNSSGFTLIELVISAALAAMILVSAYMCLNAAVSSQKLIEPRGEVMQNARVALALLSADLRAACPLSKDFQLLGMHRMVGDVEADNLDFATHNYSPNGANEGDFCQLSFFLEQDKASGKFSLWRRRNPAIGLDPLAGGSREEIVRGLRGLKFEYYDGDDWYDDWGEINNHGKQKSSSLAAPNNLSGMPEAVRITLWFDPNPQSKVAVSPDTENVEPPMVFQTVARLNLAVTADRTSEIGFANTGASDGTGQGTPGTGNGGRNQ